MSSGALAAAADSMQVSDPRLDIVDAVLRHDVNRTNM